MKKTASHWATSLGTSAAQHAQQERAARLTKEHGAQTFRALVAAEAPAFQQQIRDAIEQAVHAFNAAVQETPLHVHPRTLDVVAASNPVDCVIVRVRMPGDFLSIYPAFTDEADFAPALRVTTRIHGRDTSWYCPFAQSDSGALVLVVNGEHATAADAARLILSPWLRAADLPVHTFEGA